MYYCLDTLNKTYVSGNGCVTLKLFRISTVMSYFELKYHFQDYDQFMTNQFPIVLVTLIFYSFHITFLNFDTHRVHDKNVSFCCHLILVNGTIPKMTWYISCNIETVFSCTKRMNFMAYRSTNWIRSPERAE